MSNRYRTILGITVGLMSSTLILGVFSNLFSHSLAEWIDALFVEPDWFSWAVFLSAGIVPTVVGAKLGISDEDIWKILLLPILTGAAITIIVTIISIIIHLIVTGQIFLVFVVIALFSAFCAPATKLILIIFE